MLNKYMIVGHLGQDPDKAYTDSGVAICRLSVATNRNWRNKDGERKEEVTWHRVVTFGKQAEACGEYLKKGSMIFAEGRFQSREYEDKEGNRRWSAECVADRVQFLGKGGGPNTGGGGSGQSSDMDDVPF